MPVEGLAALAAGGVTVVGENRAQDLAAKVGAHGDAFTWDFIGHVQSRKVKQIAPLVRLIHSVCTDSVLEQLGRHAPPELRVLVEVNVAGEEGKDGVAPDDLDAFLERCPVAGERAHDDAAAGAATRATAGAGSPRCASSRRRAACPSCRWERRRTTRSPSRRARRSCGSARSSFGSDRAGEPRERSNLACRMAFRDSWHRALVYFGLAEERPFVDEFEIERQRGREDEIARERERERERACVPRRSPRPRWRTATASARTCAGCPSRRRPRDDFDDIFADDEPRGSRPTTVLRPVERARNGGDVRVHLVIPKSFNDAQQVADKFKQAIPVVLNLQATENDLAKRLIDFASGLTYALDGGMQRIAHKVFMLTPRNVQISAEEKAELIEKGFFNQS